MKLKNKTKIVCTIGPASRSPAVIRKLIHSGMNVARLNFSHGTHAEHLENINRIRELSDELGEPVAILQDLCGPKIRVGKVRKTGIRLEPGQTFILTNKHILGTQKRVSVSYHDLPLEVEVGDRILLADGIMELLVKQTRPTEIECEVVTGGILTSYKGINLPTGTIRADSLTEKDEVDLFFGLQNDVDYVALSFVRRKDDILRVKNIIKNEKKDTPIIAKIEKHEALDNIEEIINASDGIMVARGDLGVEIPLENVPSIQKMLIRKASVMGKPVIIATQMLRSMVDSPRPTRAEAADVANAVLDSADAVMLSEETASGNFPVEAVQFMSRIVQNAEIHFLNEKYLQLMPKKKIAESVAYASCVLANILDASAIIATTRSGSTARQISRFRPNPKIIALSPDKATVRRLALYWGCNPSLIEDTNNTDKRIEMAVTSALEHGNVSKGDMVVITAGHPAYVAGTTNMLKVKQI